VGRVLGRDNGFLEPKPSTGFGVGFRVGFIVVRLDGFVVVFRVCGRTVGFRFVGLGALVCLVLGILVGLRAVVGFFIGN
jgi:hypothetical protein